MFKFSDKKKEIPKPQQKPKEDFVNNVLKLVIDITMLIYSMIYNNLLVVVVQYMLSITFFE